MATTSFPLNLITAPIFNHTNPNNSENYGSHNEIISHSALVLGTKLDYSVGSRESGVQCGFQHINHTFQRQWSQQQQDKQRESSTASTTTTPSTITTPWSKTSTGQSTFSLSTTKGLGFNYHLEWSPLPSPSTTTTSPITTNNTASREYLDKRMNGHYDNNQGENTLSSRLFGSRLPRFYLNFTLSALLPFQLTEDWFRLHHSFPLLPLPHQPFVEIDATPCSQQLDGVDGQQHQLNLSPQSWYPANYTSKTTSTTSTAATTTTATPTTTTQQQQDGLGSSTATSSLGSSNPNQHNHYLDQSTSSIISTNSIALTHDPTTAHHHNNNNNRQYLEQQQYNLNHDQKSVNNDDITRRLSLCSTNGEWKSVSKSGATPSPIWNPYEGLKFNIGFGMEF